MKVLMIGQLPKEAGGNYTTGAAKVVYELSKQKSPDLDLYTYATNVPHNKARGLSSYDHQYVGYHIRPFYIIWKAILHPFKTIKEWKHFIRIDHMNPLRLAFYQDNINKSIMEIVPDVIHVHSIGLVSVTKFACDGLCIPIILTCHGVFYRGDEKDIVGHNRYIGNISLCDYYTGLTKESRLEFRDILKVDLSKVTIIPNGVDSSKFYYSPIERDNIRNQYGTLKDTTVFLTVASLQQRKGQLDFLRYLEQLDIKWEYWLIGKGEDADKIQTYVQEHHMRNKVRLLGYITSDELYKYYSAADVYAHVSYKEGQALSELEAYSTGLPAIVNKDIENTLAVDSHSENYFIFDMNDFNGNSIIEWIYKNRIRVSQNNFDWSVIALQYYQVYKKITES